MPEYRQAASKEKALYLSGEIAGVCYNKEGFNALKDEKKEKTLKRINDTLNNGHHSVLSSYLIYFLQAIYHLIYKIYLRYWQ